jgi:hypothetical protein
MCALSPDSYTWFRSSRLYLDGAMVVDNEGLHGMVDKCVSRFLSGGPHVVYIEGFQAGGGVGMIARYSGPDTDNERILMMSGRVSSRYYGTCRPDYLQADSHEFSVCMFKSDSWLSVTPRIGDNVATKLLTYVGTGTVAVLDMHDLNTFRALVPQTPNVNYVWGISGQLKIENPGTYNLCISSDDGCVNMDSSSIDFAFFAYCP